MFKQDETWHQWVFGLVDFHPVASVYMRKISPAYGLTTVQFLIFIMASKIIVYQLNFGTKTITHLNIILIEKCFKECSLILIQQLLQSALMGGSCLSDYTPAGF